MRGEGGYSFFPHRSPNVCLHATNYSTSVVPSPVASSNAVVDGGELLALDDVSAISSPRTSFPLETIVYIIPATNSIRITRIYIAPYYESHN